jgi:hypothetical protein
LCLLQPPNASLGGSDVDAGPGGLARATCTATCDNNDDCDPETTAHCMAGFVCAVAVQAGPFCCRKLCVCKSDLIQGVNVDPDGGVIRPAACDPMNPYLTCANVKK